MKFIKKHWKKFVFVTTTIILLGLAFIYIWETQNIGLNKEHLLRKAVSRYSELIEVGFIEKAFDEYLTPDSKLKITPGRKQIPMTDEERKEQTNKINECKKNTPGSAVNTLICINKFSYVAKFEDIQVSAKEVFEKYATDRKNNWGNVSIKKIVFVEKNRADVILTVRDKEGSYSTPIETWYFINGRWLRDF